MKKIIYRDFNHWWSTSEAHGMTSASRDWMKQIWDDIEPTIKASQDEYKQAYLKLMKDEVYQRCELTDAMLEYIKEFRKEGEPKFWRWWLDKNNDAR